MWRSDFLKTFNYAGSVMRRALIEAPQFAHVAEADIDQFMERAYANLSRTDNFIEALVCKEIPKVFRADAFLRAFQDQFGHLCPVCHCVVPKDEERKPLHAILEFMPSWLDYETDDKAEAHAECALLANEMLWDVDLTLKGNARAGKNVALALQKKGPLSRLFELLERKRRHIPPLRFDPKTVRRDRGYQDTRYVIDIPYEEVERLWESHRIQPEKPKPPPTPWHQLHRADLSNFF